MAFPGLGFRTVNSLLLEIGFHLVEPYCYSILLSSVAAGPNTVPIASLGTPVNALYPGAQIVVDTGLSEEIVTVTATNPSVNPPTFTATFALPHASNIPAIAATFPTQAASGDPFFTQTEILSYVARAQNEFLAQVPLVFALNNQTVRYGDIYQQLVCDAVEMVRVSSTLIAMPLISLTRSNNLVVAVSQSPHSFVAGSKFSIVGGSDPSFVGAFKVGSILSPTSWNYPQVAIPSSSTEGLTVSWTRLYPVSQQQLSMQNPTWRDNFITKLSSWFEDRTGNYLFGVNGKPASNFPIEVLVSVRDTDYLQLTDGFLVPDLVVHLVKYKALEYIFSKDGEQRDPKRAEYCRMRFERGVMATKRWLDGLGMETGMGAGKGTGAGVMSGKALV